MRCPIQSGEAHSASDIGPQERAVAGAGITHTQVADHPLRPGVRQKLKLDLPEGAQLNGNGELEDVDIDLGVVMSARRCWVTMQNAG